MDKFNGFLDTLASLIGPMFAALVGTLTRHTHIAAKYGIPVNWGRVALDAPSILLMGIIGGALGQYALEHYHTPELFTWGLAAAFGYTGPTIVDTIIEAAKKRLGSQAQPPKKDDEKKD